MVDADACPVKPEIVRIAREFGISVEMVASHDHRLQEEDGVRIVQVDSSDQSVDLFIANRLQRGDVLVTQDFGLATIGLARQAVALSVRGQIYSERTIDFLLQTRHESAKKRRSGQRTKGPKAFTDEDRRNFQQTLTKVLVGMQENGGKQRIIISGSMDEGDSDE
ncbi:YaiI/YqxD family protein [Paenibacillus sp. y28]|uniref:YaiI/YqxD family protein n=1 Tax=Paenibacillus sp. y28 TaxID=3129110 RepID=UPI0030168EB7